MNEMVTRGGGEGKDAMGMGAVIRAQESGRSFGFFTVEKWSEEACEFVRKAMMLPKGAQVPSEFLRMFEDPFETLVTEPNLLLNEGIQEMWDLIIAAAGTTAYNNANAEVGVGNSTTAAAATDTGLIGASTLFKAMVATYPIRTSQTVDFRSDFTTSEANFAWEEFSVRNGNTRNKNMNRKVQALGTKTTGTWTLTASITLS